MRCFYTNDFPGHMPTGTAAVVVARDLQQARRRLNSLLVANGLPIAVVYPEDRYTIHEVKDGPAVMLQDGDY